MCAFIGIALGYVSSAIPPHLYIIIMTFISYIFFRDVMEYKKLPPELITVIVSLKFGLLLHIGVGIANLLNIDYSQYNNFLRFVRIGIYAFFLFPMSYSILKRYFMDTSIPEKYEL